MRITVNLLSNKALAMSNIEPVLSSSIAAVLFISLVQNTKFSLPLKGRLNSGFGSSILQLYTGYETLLLQFLYHIAYGIVTSLLHLSTTTFTLCHLTAEFTTGCIQLDFVMKHNYTV